MKIPIFLQFQRLGDLKVGNKLNEFGGLCKMEQANTKSNDS